MVKNHKPPLRNLSIHLIKEQYNNAESILRPEFNLNKYPVGNNPDVIGNLYVLPSRPKVPKWASLFENYIEPSHLGRVSTTSSVFLIESNGRLFAITFGQGRHLIVADCIEDRFGLRVALNSIGENKLRSIDKRTFDAISRHTREQASQEATAQDFGLDIEQDLLRAVTGSPNDITLGNRLSGMDSLSALVRIEIGNIKQLLARYYEKYLDTSYQRNFPWVDQISEVMSSELRGQLDQILVDHLQAGNLDRCWLAVPEIIDWAHISGFRYSFTRHSPEYHDIHFPHFLESIKDISGLTKKMMSQRHVHCIGEDDIKLLSWSVYKCIYCEIDHNNDSFLLTNGKWYRVTRDFVNEVNKAFERIPRYSGYLPEYNDSSESEYNKRVAAEYPETFALMDQKNIQYGGGYNRIEFCDLFTASKDIIHIKRYGSSSVLSHLFSQGLVSGELFQTDAGFRKDVNKILPSNYQLQSYQDRPAPNQYQIVFAVISDAPDDLVLPFFSRLNLKHATRRLEGYGYKVALAKIMVSDAISKLLKFS